MMNSVHRGIHVPILWYKTKNTRKGLCVLYIHNFFSTKIIVLGIGRLYYIVACNSFPLTISLVTNSFIKSFKLDLLVNVISKGKQNMFFRN